ncbi:MAG: FimD/PapC N-terminal domain-containing protein, partial [Selenomonadaceae bacterium]
MKQTLIYLTIPFMMLSWTEGSYAGDIIFNTDLLDVKDKESIESGAFKRAGYIIPGDYTMQLIVNNVQVGERKIRFYEQTENSSQLCLTAELASELGLKQLELKRLLASQPRLLADEQACFDPAILEGIVIKGEINKDTLTISVPQAYRDYASDSWDPPSRWDEGVNGVLLDYGLTLQESHSAHGNGNSTNASAYGVAGINTGTWRLRADWQGRYQRNESQGGDEHAQSDFDVNRVY